MTEHTVRKAFNSPEDLLQLEDSWSENYVEFQLRLLMPLGSQQVLDACREHSRQRPNYPTEGRKESSGGKTKEILDLTPLFAQWRSAWASFSSSHDRRPQGIVFDIDLPQSILWTHEQVGGFCIVGEGISRFVQGLATVMWMRRGDVAIRFALEGGDEHRIIAGNPLRIRRFGALEHVLEQLSRKRE